MKIINEAMKTSLLLWLRLFVGQQQQEEGNITVEISSTTYEYKAEAQLWVTPCIYELSFVLFTHIKLTTETYLTPPEKQPEQSDSIQKTQGNFSSAPIQRRTLEEGKLLWERGTVVLRNDMRGKKRGRNT